jgi:DNA repair exonuclease SbcCD ATPase subunit
MKHVRLNKKSVNLICRKMRGIRSISIRRTFILGCSIVYLFFSLSPVYAQTSPQGGKQEQVLSSLEQKMISFLSTVKGKQEELQSQIKTLELELQNHQAKKKKKKDKAADELKEQSLKKEIAVLSAKMEQYKKLENEANTFLSSVKDKHEYVQAHPEWQPNTGSVAKNQPSRQVQTVPTTERERQIQAVQKNIAELTEEINRRKQASQTTSPSSEREKRIQELEKNAIALTEQINKRKQQQSATGEQIPLTEKEKRIQEVMQRIEELTEEINRRKQASQIAATPEKRGKPVQESKQEVPDLNQQVRVEPQSQQKPAFVSGQTPTPTTTTTTATTPAPRPTTAPAYRPTTPISVAENAKQNQEVSQSPIAQSAKTEREKQIEEVMQRIEDLTEEINRRKQAAATAEQKQQGQVAASTNKNKQTKKTKTGSQQELPSEKDKQIKELEAMVASLNTQVKTYTQKQQKQTTTYEQKQKELVETISDKDRKIQELERNLAMLSAQPGKSSSQKQGSSSTSRNQPTASQRSYTSYSKNQPITYQGNVSSGYYIIFGSFIERSNAEKFLDRLQRQYVNVIDLGNDNIFGMYRTGIGPYKTKEEAIANRPTNARNWVLRVETIPNTKLVAYFEILDE